MKLQNVALALGLAAIGAVQQVKMAQAAMFSFDFSSLGAGSDSGFLSVTTDDATNLIQAITGTINGDTVTGLSNGPFEYDPETPGVYVYTPDNKIAFESGNIKTSYTGFGVNTTGLTYNFYSLFAPEDNSALAVLDGVASFDSQGIILTNNSPGTDEFPVGSNFDGITATAVPEPNAQAALLGLPLLVGMQMLKKRKAVKA